MNATGKYDSPQLTKAAVFSALLLSTSLVIAQEDTPSTEAAEQQPVAAAEPTHMTKYTCSLNGLVRRVEINYATDNSPVPCDVNYYKDSEAPNEVNTLWSAQNLTGYCEQKAGEFVDKLQSWGWQCSAE